MGTRGRVSFAPVKKEGTEGGAASRTTGLGDLFGLPHSCQTLLILHVGLKIKICEVGMELILVRSILIFMDPDTARSDFS